MVDRGAVRFAVLVLGLALGLVAVPAAASTLRVNDPREDRDVRPGDGACATAAGACTLRAALEEAHARSRPVEIVRPSAADPTAWRHVRGGGGRTARSAPTATFVVDTAVDAVDAHPGDGVCATAAGACALRAAIQEANELDGHQAITLPAGHYPLTIAGPDDDTAASGDLDVLDRLTLTGASAALTVVDGADVARVFDNLAEGFTLTGVHVTNGAPHAFAAFLAGSALVECTLTDSGTGLHQQGVALSLDRVRFAHNETAAHLSGLAIAVTDTTVEHNGVGFELDLGSRGTVRRSGFRHNAGAAAFLAIQNEIEFDGVEVADNGSGLSIGLGDFANYVTIVHSLIERNDGPGVRFRDGSLTIADSVVRDNTACAVQAGGVGGGAITIAATLVERNGCGVALDTTPLAFTGRITASAILDNAGIGVLAAGSPFGTSLVVERTTIARNGGGGVRAWGVNGAGPFVTLAETTIVGNTAVRGGGILIARDGPTRPAVTLVNATVSGNVASDAGGGIYDDAGDLELRNVTLTANAGGGLVVAGDATAAARNTIVAGNAAADCTGALASDGYNLVGDPTGCLVSGDLTGNLTGEAGLDALAENGGPTPTHALRPDSPALDAADPAGCRDADDAPLATDQRGVPRPQFGRCDIGAFELACTGDAPRSCGPCARCDAVAGCVAAPLPDCRQPTTRVSGELEISLTPHRRLEWRWTKGEATSRADLGDPLGGDRYALCLFDESSGTPRLAFAAATRVDPCGRKSCWKPIGKRGYQHHAPQSNVLLQKAALTSGTDGAARIAVAARGRALLLPPLPLALPMRVQFQGEDGRCWESRFLALGAARNDAKHFRGRAVLP